MNRAIILLEHEMVKCITNHASVESKLSLMNHETADQSEKQRLRAISLHLKESEMEYFEAIKILKSKQTP